MNRPLALVWLVLTLAPFVYLFVADLDTSEWGYLIAVVTSYCLVAVYIIYLFKTDHVAKDKKALWAVVLFLANLVAMPVFWFLYVWRPLSSKASNLAA